MMQTEVMAVARDTLVDLVREQGDRLGDAVFLRYLLTGDVLGPAALLTYSDLVRRASGIAATLQRQGSAGDRALLLYPSGVEFVAAYVGCLFAGIVPVPVYPPDLAKPERAHAKLRGIVTDCDARLALTTAELLPRLQLATPAIPELAQMRWLATDDCDASLPWTPPAISGETVALLQYTSGSTGAPKGAVVRHRQLLANGVSIASSMGPVGTIVGWLPVFHDMGLIGNVLQALHTGSTLVLMSPIAFLKRPARWLEAISHHRAITSGGPNFAYELCLRRVSEEERSRLDLSSWEVAFCGAEPVRAATYERFSALYEASGFSRSAFYPCYGLAEATLFVAGCKRGAPPTIRTLDASALDRGDVVPATTTGDDTRTLVGCGQSAASEDVRIVDPDRAVAVAPSRVGEIWVRGPAITSGYWGRGDDEKTVFGAQLADTGEGPFLRTGDYGFVLDGELFIAGRRKDMIILGGRNLFPQDIEATIEANVPAIRKACCVAFSIDREGEERLVIVAARERAARQSDDDVVRAIKRAVAEHHHAAVFDVALVASGSIPKTSSGKLERYACRSAYASGALKDS